MQFKIENKDKYVHSPYYYFDWNSVWNSLVTDYGFTEHYNKFYYKLGNYAIRRKWHRSIFPWNIEIVDYVYWTSSYGWQHPEHLEKTINLILDKVNQSTQTLDKSALMSNPV